MFNNVGEKFEMSVINEKFSFSSEPIAYLDK